jgi:hypothetical protein
MKMKMISVDGKIKCSFNPEHRPPKLNDLVGYGSNEIYFISSITEKKVFLRKYN